MSDENALTVSRAIICKPGMFLKSYGAANVIFVQMRVNQHLDRLVRDFSDGFWNVLAIAGRRIENGDTRVGYKKGGLPAVVRKCVKTVEQRDGQLSRSHQHRSASPDQACNTRRDPVETKSPA